MLYITFSERLLVLRLLLLLLLLLLLSLLLFAEGGRAAGGGSAVVFVCIRGESYVEKNAKILLLSPLPPTNEIQ
ncbi:hypothetical protein BDV35DRAFT_361245 [Aspergillus flavus]|uniref:Uncharacterized protein n=1 Tax=Aspergillus flavus TaxID=5059 RepID=A0A5N6GUC2_ASPFL|nr:hypothetical protein BDV35DRAFT_361245 [Aspergillus flavus]